MSSPRALDGAVGSLAIDLVTAEVVRAFQTAHIPTILLKGPSIARWLYEEDGERTYCDSDLLVPPSHLAVAERALSNLGFVDLEGGRRVASLGVQWCRPDDPRVVRPDNVDLHVTLNGVGSAPEEVWTKLSARIEPIRVAGAEMSTLSPVPRTMNLALHAALSGIDMPQATEDLRRGLAQLPTETWEAACGLAASLSAIRVFTAGLRLLPQGAQLADRLGLPSRAPVEIELRGRPRPDLAIGIAMLQALPTRRARTLFVLYKMFPAPVAIRRRFPEACRGRLGVGPGYLLLWAYYARRAPAGYLAWYRARRGDEW